MTMLFDAKVEVGVNSEETEKPNEDREKGGLGPNELLENGSLALT